MTTLDNSFQIKILPGEKAKPLVDPFYKENGSKGFAREGDVFFIALGYGDNRILGCVRYCVEENTSMLRTMMIAPIFRRQKVGTLLLNQFANYLDDNRIKSVYCLPYPHLEFFYGSIGFQTTQEMEIPEFLKERIKFYGQTGTNTICMKRL